MKRTVILSTHTPAISGAGAVTVSPSQSKTGRRLLSVALTLCLAAGLLLPAEAQAASVTVTDYTALQTATSATGAAGDVITLGGNITGAATLTISRSLTLDLKGKSLTITVSDSNVNGIKIATGVTLTIKDSSPGANKLTVTNSSGLTNTAGHGAGINTTDGMLIIQSGAGIGGGQDGAGGTIIITDGTVAATGGNEGAGIGGGYYSAGGTIIITADNVTATHGNDAEDIGHGRHHSDSGNQIDLRGPNASANMKGNVTLPRNITIPAGKTLTITSGHTLTVPTGVTLTNNGTIINCEGTITNNGTITGNPASCPVAPTITTTSLPNGTVGTAYSQTLTATGTAPITWSVSTGSLPNGLSLSAAGVITGTPTTAETASVTVQASNSVSPATKTLSITIAQANQTITWNQTLSPPTAMLRLRSRQRAAAVRR
jgi:hypothetical protein